MVDLRDSVRQGLRERIPGLDDVAASVGQKCLKNRVRTGRQPTMMPIATSAKLGGSK